MVVHYRSLRNLTEDTLRWSAELPKDFDLIVGIPRSGMLVANLLSLFLNVPYADLDGFCEGRVIGTGERGRFFRRSNGARMGQTRKILVVDDSVASGSAMEAARKRIAFAPTNALVEYGVLYVTPEKRAFIQHHFLAIPTPRIFAWNLLHSWVLDRACVDIDGVLCRDPTEEENDDGPQYKNFVDGVQPLYLPTAPIGHLVTCRLEKYRPATEAWLDRHGVRYRELIMMDYADKEARQKAAAYSSFKADAYRKTDAMLFVESSFVLATAIARQTGKDVFCTEIWDMVRPASYERLFKADARKIGLLWSDPKRFARAIARRIRASLRLWT